MASDGHLDVPLAMPKELGGTGNGTNPEQLFADGWAACFATSMAQVAKRKGIDVRDVAVTAEVSLVRRPDGTGFTLAATLRTELPEHLQGETGIALLEATHQVCPYSSATRGNIPVELAIE